MTSKQRVFSTKNDINYNDYTKNKNGKEILQNIKSKNVKIIKKFINYNEFITLTKAYYNYLDQNEKCANFFTTNLYNSNISYKIYNKTIDHITNCDCCGNNGKENIYINKNKCEELTGILYPYGEYISNNISNIYFPGNLCLNNWCLKKKNCYFQEDNNYFKKKNNNHFQKEDNNYFQKEDNNNCQKKDFLKEDNYNNLQNYNNLEQDFILKKYNKKSINCFKKNCKCNNNNCENTNTKPLFVNE